MTGFIFKAFLLKFMEKSSFISFTIIEEYFLGEVIPTSFNSIFKKLSFDFVLLLIFL